MRRRNTPKALATIRFMKKAKNEKSPLTLLRMIESADRRGLTNGWMESGTYHDSSNPSVFTGLLTSPQYQITLSEVRGDQEEPSPQFHLSLWGNKEFNISAKNYEVWKKAKTLLSKLYEKSTKAIR